MAMTDAPKFLKASEIGEMVKVRIAAQVNAAFIFHEAPPFASDVERAIEAIFADPDVDAKIKPFPIHPQTRAPFIGGHIDGLVQKVIAQLQIADGKNEPPNEETAAAAEAFLDTQGAPADPVLTLEETPDEGYRPDWKRVPRVPRRR
jgi:hypothetical protein